MTPDHWETNGGRRDFAALLAVLDRIARSLESIDKYGVTVKVENGDYPIHVDVRSQ